MVYGFEKTWYTIQNLVTTKEYPADVMHLKPFYFDPQYITPLNIATKDTDETIVEQVIAHNFEDPYNKTWLVRWFGDAQPKETWTTHDNLKDVEAFHHYCAAHKLNAFLPKKHPLYSASIPSVQRRAPDQFAIPSAPQPSFIGPQLQKRGRGRPANNGVAAQNMEDMGARHEETPTEESAIAGEGEQKRKRGRPPKQPSAATREESVDLAVAAPSEDA
jgi:hypothetical protein